ncbi:uncharacterized protein LAJ45_01141 [Morchella importuna]|uniref:uncharacterized protein n=1 Tax=Morchella importuna TaxID=1174673 RepID=UPI001E8E82B0|nr:uncharacterized protein LAJ45_01141 [Morchella importuna]KAH8154613.1 hypothetical protein LAJ45_01141 [Morchella importuna]
MVTRVQDQVYDLPNSSDHSYTPSDTLPSLTYGESTPTSVSSSASSVLTIFSGTTTGRHENYSSFCGLCRDIRRHLLSGNILSDVDLGHWDDHGRTTDAHKRKWAGKLREIINTRSARLKDCTVMMNALAGHSFVSMADMLQALKEQEVGGAQSALHIVDAEEATEDISKVDWEGIGVAMSDRSNPVEESFGNILIGHDVSAETRTDGILVVITPEAGEPLSERERAKMERMEEKSSMVFFGEFESGEELEWAMVPAIMDTDSMAATEDTITTDGTMATGDTATTETTVTAEELDEKKV